MMWAHWHFSHFLYHVRRAVQGIMGNVGRPWESFIPSGIEEAGNASSPNKTAEQKKIWGKGADWTIEWRKSAHTHTLPLAIVHIV